MPAVSVVIRSYERGAALLELVEAVLHQRDAPAFEVIVVEQSQRLLPEHRTRLAELERDPRVRILRHPPLGGPAARNLGARAARGEILVFMDDDDLPASDDWLARHVANFVDERCLAVTGRQLEPAKPPPSPAQLARARRRVLSFIPILMWQCVYTVADRRRRIESVHGGNTSIRRSVLERVGLWDECTTIEDEQSFNYRLRRDMQTGEYLCFDPSAAMIRRRDIAGGMSKRELGVAALGARMFEFQHRVLAHYFPVRFVALYPVYIAMLYVLCVEWIWNDLHHQGSALRRTLLSLGVLAAFPLLYASWTVRLASRIRRRPARRGIERAPVLEPLAVVAR
jgi:glycosyltransferase involved in cell wall biosynthesis